MSERMTKHRLDEIGWTDWTDLTPAETGAVVLELINEAKDRQAEVQRLRASLAQIASFCKLPHESDFDCPSTVAAKALAAES